MSTANDRAVLNMILNPLLPNEPFDPNGNPNPADPCETLPRFAECREIEKAGIQAAEEEKLDEAIEKFNAAIEICPQNPHPYNNRAQAYRLQNKIDGMFFGMVLRDPLAIWKPMRPQKVRIQFLELD